MSAVKQQALVMEPIDLKEFHVGSRIRFEFSVGRIPESLQVSGVITGIGDDTVRLRNPMEWYRGAENTTYLTGEKEYTLSPDTSLSVTPGRATARALREQESPTAAADEGRSPLAKITFSARKLLHLVES